MPTPQQILVAAAEAHRAGDMRRAEQEYQRVLAAQPRNPDALHLLGLLYRQTGRTGEAIIRLHEAAETAKTNPDFWHDLATALSAEGNFADAVDAFSRTLALQPGHCAALLGRAYALRNRGDLKAAVDDLLQVVERAPDNAVAHTNLGAALQKHGDARQAERHLQIALKLNPRSPEAHSNLGLLLIAGHRTDEAIVHLRAAVECAPAVPETHLNLGTALLRCRDPRGAIDCFERAIGLRPDFPEALRNLSLALMQLREYPRAQEILSALVRRNPADTEALINLGVLMRETGNLDEAARLFEEAAATNPTSVPALTNLGEVLQILGDVDAAEGVLRKAVEADPEAALARGNLLACLSYQPRTTPAELFLEHRSWGERIAARQTPIVHSVNDRAGPRPLRVGYVSPDFSRHPVGAFLLPLLAHHHPAAVEAFCYSCSRETDDRTAQFRALGVTWRESADLDDEKLCAAIAADRIDILVDCAGHTAGNRLPVFARKPAPVQITWLGYAGTTGLPTIDYRFTDAICDPAGEPVRHTEELVRLEPGFFCYAPVTGTPRVAPLPAARSGRVTFGSLHNLARLNPAVVGLWCRILDGVTDSRLLVFRTTLTSRAEARLRGLFTDQGADLARIEFRRTPPETRDHLDLYAEIDIALDTFPWSGHTTACEALWMGAPVITLRGDRHAGRMVSSLLTILGRREWIAESPDDYVRIARQLASRRDDLARTRAGLREEMLRSPVCDGETFATCVEKTYRKIWERL